MVSEQGMARIRGVLRRRRFWVAGAAALVLVAGAVLVGGLRPVYKAEAVLRVLESQPSKEYVAPTVVEPQAERLKTLRVAVMSRPILEATVDALHLDRVFRLSREAAVAELRASMDVKVEGDDTFLVTYEGSDADRAQAVVNQVARRFIDGQVRYREQVASATESALADEVARLRPELARREQAVRAFKLAHYGALPEQQEDNLRTLDQGTLQSNILATNLDLNLERKRQLVLGAMSPMRAQEAQLRTQLHAALTRYTPEHPEVQAIRAELANVRAQRVADEEKLRATAEGNPEIQSLTSEIERQRAQLETLKDRADRVRANLSATAKNAQDLAALTTDLDATRAKYVASLGKLQEAQLASSIEHKLHALRYDVVEAAARPLHPVRPNRPLLAGVALLLAMLAGLGVGFARDAADTSIYSPEELAQLGTDQDGRPLEVLACIPQVKGDERRAPRDATQAASVVVREPEGA